MKMNMTSPSKPKIFTEDLHVRDALLRHDGVVTRTFFYQHCYPLFKSIYDNYYTDCVCVKEFIDEIYILTMLPNKKTGRCQLENYKGESTLANWIKTVSLFYCYKKYKLKKRMPVFDSLKSSTKNESNNDEDDRFDSIYGTINIDFNNLDREDANTILNMMPNKRYSNIIRMLYLEHKTLAETAEALGMTMKNFYNKEKLAKEQYERVLRKEAHHG